MPLFDLFDTLSQLTLPLDQAGCGDEKRKIFDVMDCQMMFDETTKSSLSSHDKFGNSH